MLSTNLKINCHSSQPIIIIIHFVANMVKKIPERSLSPLDFIGSYLGPPRRPFVARLQVGRKTQNADYFHREDSGWSLLVMLRNSNTVTVGQTPSPTESLYN